MLVEAFGDNDDEMWLGKNVEYSDYRRKSCCTKKKERQRNVCGARFNTRFGFHGCHGMARARLESFLSQRIIDVINSTDLRAVGVDM